MEGFRNIEKEIPLDLASRIHYRNHQVLSLNICDTDALRMVLFSFDKAEAITEETTPNTEQFFILEGEMEVILGDKSMRIKKGETLLVKPEVEHSLLALSQVKMLQTSYK